MNPLVFFTHFKCVSEARQNKLPKIPFKRCWEHLAFCARQGGHLFWFLRHLDTCIFKARSERHAWEATRWFLFFFFCWKEMFLHNEKHCMYCPRCRHFYKSEFRFHSLLAHFIICIFLLYRLNIFYVNSWPFLPPCEQYWSPQQVMMNNCAPSSPCLRIFCELNAYFLNRNWSPHGLSQCTD